MGEIESKVREARGGRAKHKEVDEGETGGWRRTRRGELAKKSEHGGNKRADEDGARAHGEAAFGQNWWR